MTPRSDQLALFRGGEGEWIAVEGPFQDAAVPSEALPSFFVNDFQLADPRPWKIGRRRLGQDELLQRLAEQQGETPTIAWGTPDREAFARVFAAIQGEIETGVLEKAVPASVQPGTLENGSAACLLGRLAGSPVGLHAYAFVGAQRGFCGLSPEILLRTDGAMLETVALAGTARAERAAALAQDRKEIREHELVAGYLYDKLATLGQVSRQPRALRALGEMVHLESRFELQLERRWKVEELIAKLHPTPALGTQPRTAEALASLARWRGELGVPEQFGAPFGVSWEGRLEVVVAIRGLWWEGDQLCLPTGCGLIRESQVEREWAELALKRRWVLRQFGLERD